VRVNRSSPIPPPFGLFVSHLKSFLSVEKYSRPMYDKHLQVLSFELYIGESEETITVKISELTIELDKLLYISFVYTERHTVNTVHSLIYFHEIVKDYKSRTNESSFNDESLKT
jgi:hypothetical protein